ncbi:prephenate dehydrogenase [Candidatus Leptofilum sp.]|uniref:prephenate dehydrogenase n=1 Tax=Candidatus Leptofilum sp. TaxID=3241576 RepID=UPI003B5BA6AB
MQVERICVVGLGLMGGSLALALRLARRLAIPQRPFHLTIVDTNPKTRAAAGRIADFVSDDLALGVEKADLIVLATPVRTIVNVLNQLPRLRPDGCLVLDLGSSKTDICQAMDNLTANFQAIGGHPMCGKEVAGFGAATPDMFRQHTFILCPTQRTTPHMETVAHQLVADLGANPLVLPPTLHDNMVAVVSHLPYMVATALMRNAASLDDDRLWPVSSSGFRDTSRVSGTDPQMMLDILLTNKTAVLQQIAHYQSQLGEVAALIEANDEEKLMAWLTETQEAYWAYREAKRDI